MNALNTLLTQSNTKETPVSLPVQLKAKYPLVQTFARQIAEHRQIIQNILAGKDQR
ncbi:3-deoxy-7-phosphoheptulonate synthase, partial [Acinetobacter baumannii]|nr:3-deoxy-7-phosphoheptulonate synthase [Acinetobacter baumannii]